MKKILPYLNFLSILVMLTPSYGKMYSQVIQTNRDVPNNSEGKKHHQIGLGITGGYNYANVTNAATINASSRSGYTVGIIYMPGGFKSKPVLGYRTELLYSRQGYNYEANTNTGHVNLDYLIMPHFTTINITRYVQIQIGGQIALLLNAGADSTLKSGNENSVSAQNSLMSLYNKIIYGFAGGIEVHPFKGLLTGARMNINLNNTYKRPSATATSYPSFYPANANLKSNVFQVYVGFCF